MERWHYRRGLLLPGRAPVRRGICSMLMVNQLIGFGAGSSAVQTLIDRTLGTTIGDMTSGGGLAAAFDGTTSQAFASSAYKSASATGYVGKDWGVGNTKTVTGFVAYGSSNLGFEGEGAELTITITLQGSTDNFSSSTVSLGASAGTTNSNGLVISKLTGITTTTAYRYHRLKIDAPTNTKEIICAECQFYEDI